MYESGAKEMTGIKCQFEIREGVWGGKLQQLTEEKDNSNNYILPNFLNSTEAYKYSYVTNTVFFHIAHRLSQDNHYNVNIENG